MSDLAAPSEVVHPHVERPQVSRRQVAAAVAGGVVGIGFLALAARGVDLRAAGSILANADVGLAALAAVLLVAPLAIMGIRWRLIARSTLPAPTSVYIELNFVGAALNNCLPGRVGEFARAVSLSRSGPDRRPVMEALGTVIADRAADVVFFALCFAVSAGPFLGERWAQYVAGGGILLLVVAVAVIVIAVRVVRRHPTGTAQGRIRRQLMFLARGLAAVPGTRVWLAAGAVTVVAWGVWMLGMYAAARSVGISLSPLEITFALAVLGLGTAIPSLPGFVGTYHWLTTTCLVAFGVARPDAFAFAILLHALWFVPMTAIGLPLMLRAGLRFGSFRRLPPEVVPTEARG